MMVGERIESNHYPIIVNIEGKRERQKEQQQRQKKRVEKENWTVKEKQNFKKDQKKDRSEMKA